MTEATATSAHASLRVLFVVHRSDPGGTEASFGRVAAALRAEPDLDLMLAYPEGGALAGGWSNLAPHIDYQAGHLPVTWYPRSYAGWAFDRARSAAGFRDTIREWRPDAVVSFTSVLTVPVGISRELGIPCVAYVREYVEPRAVRDILWRYLGRNAERLIAVSKPLADDLELYAPGRVRLVHDGVPLPDPMHAGAWPPPDPLISFYGGYDPIKGGDVFVAVAGMLRGSLPAARFAYHGVALPAEQPLRGRLRDLSSRLGLDGRMEFVETRAFETSFGDASVVVMPSVREGLGLVALEAMSHGVPVVASRTGGLLDVVDDGVTGALVQPGDASAFASAVKALVADPSRTAEAGHEARRRVEEHFAVSQAAAGLKATILEVVEGRTP